MIKPLPKLSIATNKINVIIIIHSYNILLTVYYCNFLFYDILYINYSGVKYLHNTGLDKVKTADAAIRLLISAIPGCGWGLSAIAAASAYGGRSSLEKAVNSTYSKKKEIKVYYKIHKAVTDMNKVRYVVG